MRIETQICSINLARKLKDIGVDQHSLLWYVYDRRYNATFIEHKYPVFSWKHDDGCVTNVNGHEVEYFEIVSAFNVAELGFLLPASCDSTRRDKNDWTARYFPKDDLVRNSFGETEADARAKLLIFLIEAKIWKPE